MKITADASAYGLGAVLLQRQDEVWKPVAYSSKSMTETERRYSQIEKEALALVWACEKFEDYVLGKEIQLETDHKPLVPLLGRTHLDCLPPRILRFRLRLMRFSYSICHVPGKELYTADALSRAPLPTLEILLPSPSSGLLIQLFQPCQQAHIVCKNTVQHNSLTQTVPNSSNTSGMDGRSTNGKCLRMCDSIGQFEEN